MATKKTQNKPAFNPNIPQRQASDPSASVWVTASAGSGKTKVLTDRVLRLLLKGTSPENILCLTFTKAGASVMKDRISSELSNWATCSDYELKRKLKDLTGRQPTAGQKNTARQLFALYQDTPGGMRIQTIHAFSQSLLRSFSPETGIPVGFEVMDDQTADEMLKEARMDVFNKAHENTNTALGAAITKITSRMSEDDFMPLLNNLVYHRDMLRDFFEGAGGQDKAVRKIYDYLDVDPRLSRDQVLIQGLSDEGLGDLIPDTEGLRQAASVMANGTKTDKDKALILSDWLSNPDKRADWFSAYKSIFLTTAGDMRKTLATKGVLTKNPEVGEVLLKEGERLKLLLDRKGNADIADSTAALMIFAGEVLKQYDQNKKAHNLLDFEDLIYHANKLLADDDAAAWTIHKLDGNIEHILVDEAQDTNPQQWNIIAAITKEFFSAQGGGSKKKGRTMFVVGDEKQSIFSFQRADPQEFYNRKKFFAEQVEKAGETWRPVEMEFSFRSVPAVLNSVDAVFASEDASDGLRFGKKDKIEHKAWRAGQGGRVELKPVVKADPYEDIAPWSLPLTREKEQDHEAKLASTIADQIADWLKNKEKLEARKRPINPSDIMILVRRRSRFVNHMVRELRDRKIPVSGVDRMSLKDHISVTDMMMLGQAVLSKNDDYTLACALKSPLIGMNDKQLEAIAIKRNGSLWDALEKKSKSKAKSAKIYKDALEYLETLQDVVKRTKTYEFYTRVLFGPCPQDEKAGWRAMYARLGRDMDDPLAEFLNAIERFEKTHPPTLQGFLSWMEDGETDVKRELSIDPKNPQVNLMTAHGAKGLQAPIVILPDTTSVPEDNNMARPRLLWQTEERPVPLWAPRTEMESDLFKAERERIEAVNRQEYRRLLYVAMTRAEDRLYVFGSQGARERKPHCWYSTVERGLIKNMGDKLEIVDEKGKTRPFPKLDMEGCEQPEDVSNFIKIISRELEENKADVQKTSPDSTVMEVVSEDQIYNGGKESLRFTSPQTARPFHDFYHAATSGTNKANRLKKVGVPLWARKAPVTPENVLAVFKPSQALIANDNKASHKDKDINLYYETPLGEDKENMEHVFLGILRGDLTHKLFEFLPELPPEERRKAAEDYLTKPVWGIDAKEQKRLLGQVMRIMEDKEFAPIFGPGSKPEVNIAGLIDRAKTKEKLSGQIDRLVVTDDEVLIVDYKSNAKVPKNGSEIPDKYLAQLAAYRQVMEKIYPGKTVKCALLWTKTAKFQKVDPRSMNRVARQIGLEAPPLKRKATTAAKRKTAPKGPK